MLISRKYVSIFLICSIQIVAGDHRDWWKYTTIYQVIVSSFKDSNGDGLGDIKGVTSMLDHFVDLGIETIWLSPIYESPMVDNGYDVSDYYKINPKFGKMEDFDELIVEMKKRKLKLMMDFVLNHSSDEHPWFLKSVDKIEPFTDYYVWKDPKGYDEKGNPIPPCNWMTFLNTSSWTWNPKRKQFYYHFLSEHEVDFNLRNPKMLKEAMNIIKFWFDKGVDAGRLDAPVFYIEDDQLRDEDYSMGNIANVVLDMPEDYRKYTQNLWESYEFIHELREFVDSQYNSQNNDEKILVSESYTSWNYTMLYYGTDSYKITHFPFNFIFVFPSYYENPKILDDSIKKWLTKMPENGVANWQVENHDMQRIADRINIKFSEIMLIIIMTLPGIACIYYGQEIGMVNTYPRSDQIQDFLGRDYARSPMQWDDSMNAGFSSNLKPWLPVNPNYWYLNVQTQKKKLKSRYNLYKTLSKLRQTPTLKYGNFTSYTVSSWIYAFVRSTSSAKDCSIIVVANMGSETEMVNLHTSIPNLPPYLKVLAASLNTGLVPGSKVYTNAKFPNYFVMRPSSAVVLST